MNMRRFFYLSVIVLTFLFYQNHAFAEMGSAVVGNHGEELKQPDDETEKLCGATAHNWVFVAHSNVEEVGDLYRWKDNDTKSPLLCASKLNKMVNPECPLENMEGTIRNQIGYDCVFNKIGKEREAAKAAKARETAIDNALDAYRNAAVQQQASAAPKGDPTNNADAPLAWDFLALSIILSLVITWGIGLAPAFIARYAIYKRPLSKKAANWIAATSCVAFAFIATALHAEEGRRANIAVWIFVFFVSRWIMTRGSEISAKEPTPEHLLLKALTDVSSCFTENEQGLFFSSIKERVKAQIAQAKKKKLLRKSLEGITPEGRVLHMIAGICFDELGTGRFHVYRGVLSLEGRALEGIFLRAIDELEKCGIMPQQEAMDSKRTISEIIKEMG